MNSPTNMQFNMNSTKDDVYLIPETNNFLRAMKFVAKWEGGFSDDKRDSGGKTNYGISDAGDGTIDGLIDLDRDGTGDVKAEELTLEQAMQVYWKFYWLAAGCDKLALDSAVAVFDTAVNCGVGRAQFWWKASDGDLKKFFALRLNYYARLRDKNPDKYGRFYKGWVNRVIDLRKYAEILQNG